MNPVIPIAPVPAGHTIVGYGSPELRDWMDTAVENGAVGAPGYFLNPRISDTWIISAGIRGGIEQWVYALPDHLVEAHANDFIRERVAYFRGEMPDDFTETSMPPIREAGAGHIRLPYSIPSGYLAIGVGGNTPQEFWPFSLVNQRYQMRDIFNGIVQINAGVWSPFSGMNGHTGAHYAMTQEAALHDRTNHILMRNIRALNHLPDISVTFPDIPPEAPPLLEGQFMLGYGASDLGESVDHNLIGGSVRFWPHGEPQWGGWTMANRGDRAGWAANAESRLYSISREEFDKLPISGQVALRPRLDFYNPGWDGTAMTPEISATDALTQKWTLLCNGSPIASLEELKGIITPLLTSANSAIADSAWNARFMEEPEAVLENWMDREPVVAAILDFSPLPRALGAEMNEQLLVIPDETSMTGPGTTSHMARMITRATAGALLHGGMGDHFQFDGGAIVINPDNPPSLEQGYEFINRTFEVKVTGDRLDNFACWTLGSALDQLERFFGEEFDLSTAVGQTKKAYNTATCSLGVWKAYGHRRRNLSFTHHREAWYAKIDDEHKDWILDTAERLQLSVKEMRKLTSHIRHYGQEAIDAMEETPANDTEELMDRIEVKSAVRTFLFRLRNEWYEYRGPFENIPNGASEILDGDSREVVDASGERTKMGTWVPAGVPVLPPRGHEAERIRQRDAARNDPDFVVSGSSAPREPIHHQVDVIDQNEALRAAQEVDRILAPEGPPPVGEPFPVGGGGEELDGSRDSDRNDSVAEDSPVTTDGGADPVDSGEQSVDSLPETPPDSGRDADADRRAVDGNADSAAPQPVADPVSPSTPETDAFSW